MLGESARDAPASGARGDRVREAGEHGLEAEVLADAATVEEGVESARALGFEPSGGGSPTDANSVAKSGASSSTTL